MSTVGTFDRNTWAVSVQAPYNGKSLRRSFDRVASGSPLHVVSAWTQEERLVLEDGQIAGAIRIPEAPWCEPAIVRFAVPAAFSECACRASPGAATSRSDSLPITRYQLRQRIVRLSWSGAA